ncbi:RNA polymerase I-specific transcription initiation factor Rrn7 [Venturia nashicola]|uniref:RNA polymerase I-specific transcription initiation factor Rrn7 n=1 Tax=Venturia nashicola TaxID=86259 RepID=A0A4Z1PRY7_9PEZI|nr:RNA polymerase I-specific transcription initiation factor Rrn7 [Venturia nashicola]
MSSWRLNKDGCVDDTCSSKRIRTEHSGHIYCDRGHFQGIETANRDEDEFEGASHGRTSRRQKEEKEKVLKHLTGKPAFELYLLCYQLILRKQVWWLIHEKGLSVQLDVIVHDLWALRMQNLPQRMSFDSLHDSDSQSQMFSSQSEDTSGETTATDFTSRAVRSVSTPTIVQSLALCYMGIWLLRLPITLGDLIKWVKQGELLYFRAIKEIPREMKDRLPGQYHYQLDPQSQLTAKKLHHAVTATFLFYQKDFSMKFPPLNVPLQLFRCIEELALPIEVYPAVQRLASLLSYDFAYLRDEQKKKLRIIDFPEAQLISTVIIAVKLLYPFDGIKRYPLSIRDPSLAILDWITWVQARQEYEDHIRDGGKLLYEDAANVSEMDVLKMTDSKIDDYLDYFDKTWTVDAPHTRDKDADFRTALMDMFPVGQRTSTYSNNLNLVELKSRKLKAVQGAMKTGRVVTREQERALEKKIVRPGSLYRRYRLASELDGHAMAFYTAAADYAGLDLQSVVRAVHLTEQKLQIMKEEWKIEASTTAMDAGSVRSG